MFEEIFSTQSYQDRLPAMRPPYRDAGQATCGMAYSLGTIAHSGSLE